MFAAEPGSTQEWISGEGTAGLSVNGSYAGISFQCVGDARARLVFSGFPGALQEGRTYTVVATVDGTSFMFNAAAEGGAPRFDSILVETRTLSELASFLDMLKKGAGAEVAGPAGRYTVPLRGSGAALEAFLADCR